MIAVLTGLWIASLGGTPPPSVLAVGIVNSALGILVLAWAYWVDRLRAAVKG
jgi:hypothetical protein